MLNVIFDIDGVLIDVRRSFHDTIKSTVTYYLKEFLDIPVKRQAISEEDIQSFKLLGGFNDDWDLTAGMLYYFVSLIPKSTISFKDKTVKEIQDLLRFKVKKNNNIFLKKDIAAFVRKIKSPGIKGILKATGEKNKDLVLYEGDVLDSNLVKRVFQEIYWGIDMFPRVYNEKNKFCFKPGKVHKEMLIADRLLLKKLSEKKDVVLSIVTGREKFDAEYSLEKYDIRKFFSNIITLTDIKDKKFKKPDPYCLNLLETQIKKPIKQRFYVGDQIDDIKMVNSVRKDYDIKGIGFLYNPKDLETRELFKKNKADYVVDNWRNLGEILVG